MLKVRVGRRCTIIKVIEVRVRTLNIFLLKTYSLGLHLLKYCVGVRSLLSKMLVRCAVGIFGD
jgi:hypothetical protein